MFRKKLFWIGIVFSAVFLYLALRKVDAAAVADSFRSAKIFYLVAAELLLLVYYLLLAIRWRYIIAQAQKVSLMTAFSIMMIGFFANNVLPARAGEFLRAYVLGKKEGISKSFCFGTIVIERFFDMLTLLMFLLVVVLFLPLPLWVRTIGYLSSIIFVFALSFLLLMVYGKMKAMAFAEKLFFFLSQERKDTLLSLLERFASGLQILKRKRQILTVLVLSIASWFLNSFVLYCALGSFDIHIPTLGLFAVLSIINLGVLVPSSPGYIGTYQFLCVSTLSMFSVQKATALSFSIIFHALWYFPLTFLGFFFIWKENISFVQFKQPVKNGVKQHGNG